MKASIITIGDEILIGQIVDTNSAWLGKHLSDLGFEVEEIRSISDTPEAIYSTLSNCQSDLMIITGGLGPTQDDLTKKVLCEFTKGQMYFDNEVYKRICKHLENKGVPVNTLNKQQAELPDSAEILPNSKGTASGMWFQHQTQDKKQHIIALPGVPYEMKAIYNEEINYRLTERFNLIKTHYKTIHTSGLAESVLAETLREWEDKLRKDGLLLAYLPRPGVVRLRIGFKSNNEELATKTIQKYIEKLQDIIPNHIFSLEELEIEKEVFNLLIKKNKTLSTAESCTGGRIASAITALAGSSKVFKGSVVAYSNDIKERILNVPHSVLEKNGAVSQEVVEAMALNINQLYQSDMALAVSGIAGPTGATKDKPIGTTWIALSYQNEVISQSFLFGEERDNNQKKASITALDMLRKKLLEID